MESPLRAVFGEFSPKISHEQHSCDQIKFSKRVRLAHRTEGLLHPKGVIESMKGVRSKAWSIEYNSLS